MLLTSHHYLVHAPHTTHMSCSQRIMQFASQYWCFEGSANSEPVLLLVHPTAKHVCLINSQSSGTLRHLRESLTAMFSNLSEPVLPKSWCFVDGECACCVVLCLYSQCPRRPCGPMLPVYTVYSLFFGRAKSRSKSSIRNIWVHFHQKIRPYLGGRQKIREHTWLQVIQNALACIQYSGANPGVYNIRACKRYIKNAHTYIGIKRELV